MAIEMPPELPPALMPQAIAAQVFKAGSPSFFNGEIGGQKVEVTRLPYLSPQQVGKLAAAASSPSQFIVNLSKVYRLNGNLLVQVLYYQKRDVVFVHAIQTSVGGISGHKLVRTYFEKLIGDKDLTISEFDQAWIMADLSAKRRGVNYSITYTSTPDFSATTINFERGEMARDAHQWTLDLGNQGNRFAGREFAGLGWRYWSKWGAEFNLNYMQALSDKAFEEVDTSYQGLVVGLNRPFSSGLYGLEIIGTQYESSLVQEVFSSQLPPELCGLLTDSPLCQAGTTEAEVAGLDADTTIGSLTGEHVLSSGPGRRWVLSEKLTMVSDKVEDVVRNVLIVDEQYSKAAIELKYLYGGRGRHGLGEGHIALGFIGGFGDESGSFADVEQQAAVSPGKRSPDFLQVAPSIRFSVGLASWFVIDLKADGLFANGRQVPQQDQFVLGGMDRMSAYLPGVLIGDSGYHASLSFGGRADGDAGFDVTPALFIEHGSARFENAAGEAGDTRSLTDAGLRVAISFGRAGSLELVAAGGIGDSNIPQQTVKEAEVDFYARLRVRF